MDQETPIIPENDDNSENQNDDQKGKRPPISKSFHWNPNFSTDVDLNEINIFQIPEPENVEKLPNEDIPGYSQEIDFQITSETDDFETFNQNDIIDDQIIQRSELNSDLVINQNVSDNCEVGTDAVPNDSENFEIQSGTSVFLR